MIYTSVPTADLRLDSPRETQNWRPLVNWLLALPHLIIANALSSVANVLSIVSWQTVPHGSSEWHQVAPPSLLTRTSTS